MNVLDVVIVQRIMHGYYEETTQLLNYWFMGYMGMGEVEQRLQALDDTYARMVIAEIEKSIVE